MLSAVCLELERQRIVKTDIGKIATPHSEYITVFQFISTKSDNFLFQFVALIVVSTGL